MTHLGSPSCDRFLRGASDPAGFYEPGSQQIVVDVEPQRFELLLTHEMTHRLLDEGSALGGLVEISMAFARSARSRRQGDRFRELGLVLMRRCRFVQEAVATFAELEAIECGEVRAGLGRWELYRELPSFYATASRTLLAALTRAPRPDRREIDERLSGIELPAGRKATERYVQEVWNRMRGWVRALSFELGLAALSPPLRPVLEAAAGGSAALAHALSAPPLDPTLRLHELLRRVADGETLARLYEESMAAIRRQAEATAREEPRPADTGPRLVRLEPVLGKAGLLEDLPVRFLDQQAIVAIGEALGQGPFDDARDERWWRSLLVEDASAERPPLLAPWESILFRLHPRLGATAGLTRDQALASRPRGSKVHCFVGLQEPEWAARAGDGTPAVITSLVGFLPPSLDAPRGFRHRLQLSLQETGSLAAPDELVTTIDYRTCEHLAREGLLDVRRPNLTISMPSLVSRDELFARREWFARRFGGPLALAVRISPHGRAGLLVFLSRTQPAPAWSICCHHLLRDALSTLGELPQAGHETEAMERSLRLALEASLDLFCRELDALGRETGAIDWWLFGQEAQWRLLDAALGAAPAPTVPS